MAGQVPFVRPTSHLPCVPSSSSLPHRCRHEDRRIEAALRFARGGGRTFLAQQSVPYPFHVTRPHYLDTALPGLATLYLQSAAGGLYRGDHLMLSVEASAGSRAHVTSQAATVAHTAAAHGIGVETRLSVASDAFLAVTSDPYILFPGTDLSVETTLTLAPGAAVLLAEGFSAHDPTGRDTPFSRLSASTRIITPDGRTLIDDRSRIDGVAFSAPDSPLGRFRATGTVFVVGQAAMMLDATRLEDALDALGILAGVSPLPGNAGLGIRMLARDGGQLGRGLDLAFMIGFETLSGRVPARRRK